MVETNKDESPNEFPEWYKNISVLPDWIDYKGETYFAMVNFEESEKVNIPMIDLCYCATAGLINNRVLKTVRYNKIKFSKSKLSSF
jgi:hypothetical protein